MFSAHHGRHKKHHFFPHPEASISVTSRGDIVCPQHLPPKSCALAWWIASRNGLLVASHNGLQASSLWAATWATAMLLRIDFGDQCLGQVQRLYRFSVHPSRCFPLHCPFRCTQCIPERLVLIAVIGTFFNPSLFFAPPGEQYTFLGTVI